MFSFFVPISLLVLGGFTLGLLVGWLTWVSSKESADQEPAEQERPNNTPDPVPAVLTRLSNWSVIRDQAPDWSPSDLPFWQMKEISAWEDLDARVSSSDVDA